MTINSQSYSTTKICIEKGYGPWKGRYHEIYIEKGYGPWKVGYYEIYIEKGYGPWKVGYNEIYIENVGYHKICFLAYKPRVIL